MRNRWLFGFVGAASLVAMTAGSSSGYDNYVYENLQRSRDALLGQRAELQHARTEVLASIDRLQQKVVRIDAYLKQVDDSVRDVDDALRNVRK